MDDVIVDIEMVNGTKHYFAIQLKHKEKKNKKLLPTNFEAKGNFSLEKYCKAFKDIEKRNKNYRFILYTNSEYNSSRKEQMTNFRMSKEDKCEGKVFFDTSSGRDGVYRFEVNDNIPDAEVTKSDYEQFFRRFTVYVGQKNFEDLEQEIFRILKNKSAGLKYLDVFRRWHQNRFTNKTIDKETVNIHLVDIFVSEFVIASHISNDLFGRIVKEFDVTIIDESVDNIDSLKRCEGDDRNVDDDLHLAKKYKIVDKSVYELDCGTKRKILQYFFLKVVLINFNQSSEDNLYQMLEHYRCSDNRIKFVLVGRGIDTAKLSNFTIFQNLQQLSKFDNLYAEVLKTCQLSMQGKDPITLEELLRICDDVDFVGPKEILFMLTRPLTIGEDKELLPPVYIHRRVSTEVPRLIHLLNPSIVKRHTLVIDFNTHLDQIRTQFEEKGITIVDIDDYYKLEAPPQTPVIISVHDEHSFEELDYIRRKNNTHALLYLKMVNPKTFIPVVHNSTEPSLFEKIFIDENNIHELFDNKMNILCAQPGMGKSTMFKLLKNQTRLWSVVVDLKAHNTFLKTKRPLSDVLAHFFVTTDAFVAKVKTAFFRKKKVVFFFDGLDELDDQCVDNVLDYSEERVELGFRVWVSSRENLKPRLVSRFKKMTIDVVEVGEKEQTEYIRGRLHSHYTDDEIEEMVDNIFGSTDIVNNRQILGIPLQLYIITQIFLDDRQQYDEMTKNFFVLTKMYRFFFDGRYKHATDKQESKNPHLVIGEPEDYFEKYEILALQFLLDDDVVQRLNLDTRRSRRFLDRIKDKKDPLGIVVGVTNDKAVFEHFTYAEYFACVFLSFNFDKCRLLQDELFSDRYKNLLQMFNVMLAEENPLHLAVIYKDRFQVQAHIDDDNIYDKAGRNPLHLAVTQCLKYPGYFIRTETGWTTMTSDIIKHIEVNVLNRQFLNHVAKFDPLTRDKLFNWNCLDYAFETRCLVAVEVILTKHQVLDEAIEHLQVYRDDGLFPGFCTFSGCLNLVKALLGDNPVNTMTNWLQKTLLRDTIAYCFFQKIEMVRFWLERGVSVDFLWEGETALHLATRQKLLDVVTVLVEGGASMDVKTDNGDTVLHSVFAMGMSQIMDTVAKGICHYKDEVAEVYCTYKCKKIDLVKLFVERGVEVNSRNKQGETALDLAVASGDSEVVDFLLQKGSDGTICNNDGLTKLM